MPFAIQASNADSYQRKKGGIVVAREIVQAKSQSDLERYFPVMKELRPHLNLQEYLSIYEKAHQTNSYQIVAIEENGKVLAVMGYRVLSDFVRGQHLYIDDLIATESARSQGLGAELLKFAEASQESLTAKF